MRLAIFAATPLQGEDVVITRRGKAVARLISAAPGHDRRTALEALDRIAERSKAMSLGGLKVKDMIEEGRP